MRLLARQWAAGRDAPEVLPDRIGDATEQNSRGVNHPQAADHRDVDRHDVARVDTRVQ